MALTSFQTFVVGLNLGFCKSCATLPCELFTPAANFPQVPEWNGDIPEYSVKRIEVLGWGIYEDEAEVDIPVGALALIYDVTGTV